MKRLAAGALIVLSLVLLAATLTLHGASIHGSPMTLGDADFVVASSRDAGPGTLRDAILAADRSSTHSHIIITAKRIVIESALPALINPRGVEIEAAGNSGTIDAERQTTGAALQISSPASTIRGLHIINAHSVAIVVAAPGAQLESLTVVDSKVGIFLGAAARGCIIRTSILERDETGITAEGPIRDVTVLSSIFRTNTRAGLWFVGAPQEDGDQAIGERLRIVDDVFEKNASGVVIGNRAVSVQKSRFIENKDSAILVLGGVARIEDSEIRASGGTAVSVTSGTRVVLAHNILIDNSSIAVMVKDSEVTIERNTLQHNGLGIVSIVSRKSFAPLIRDNVITQSGADAITLIGGAPVVQRNQIADNHGAGLRTLDLVGTSGELKAMPRLEANEFKANGVDMPASGVYRVADSL
jgi:hypothetical protein